MRLDNEQDELVRTLRNLVRGNGLTGIDAASSSGWQDILGGLAASTLQAEVEITLEPGSDPSVLFLELKLRPPSELGLELDSGPGPELERPVDLGEIWLHRFPDTTRIDLVAEVGRGRFPTNSVREVCESHARLDMLLAGPLKGALTPPLDFWQEINRERTARLEALGRGSRLRTRAPRAKAAFDAQRWEEVVRLLTPLEADLPASGRKRLEIARRRVSSQRS